MDNFNYNKPKQIAEIENLALTIGFNRIHPYIFHDTFEFKYKDWILLIERKDINEYYEDIRMQLFTMNFFQQNSYQSIHDRIYYDDLFSDYDRYNSDFDNFKDKCINLLKENFNSEIRKYKINKIIS